MNADINAKEYYLYLERKIVNGQVMYRNQACQRMCQSSMPIKDCGVDYDSSVYSVY